MSGPKILTIDIETSPTIAYVWGLRKEYIPIDRVIKPGEMICFAAKWEDEKEVRFYSAFHDGKKKMLKAVWKFLNEADWVVHFNGNAFDEKRIKTELFIGNFKPPSPYRSIDLYRESLKHFRFDSHKLEFQLRQKGLGGKMKHEGFDMWVKCMHNDPKAWEEMKKYNIQDVVKTEAYYKEMRPWIVQHPNYGLYTGELCCPRCGSKKLNKDEKKLYKNGNVYQSYRCADKPCRGWIRDNRPLNPHNDFRFHSV
jgi:hypothetical protein